MAETFTREEIEEEIQSLSAADLIRLKKCSNIFARPWISADDLLQEAYCRSLEPEGRNCPINVGIVSFLVQTMRGIANDEGQKRKAKKRLTPEIEGEEISQFNDYEEVESANEIRSEIMSLLNDDKLASEIMDGIMEGLTPTEICEITEIDLITYNSKRRLIRRRINKQYPDGWTK